MNVNDIFGGSTLKASDLQGSPATLTISGWEVVEFDDGKKISLSFHETQKRFIVNKTNARTIADILGGDTEGWVGNKITLMCAQTDFGGKQVPCIRVALPTTQVNQAPAPTQLPAAAQVPSQRAQAAAQVNQQVQEQVDQIPF